MAVDEESNQPLCATRLSNARQPTLLRLRSSKIFITFTVCFAVFTDIFLYTLIIPILPETLEKRAQIPREQIQKWVSGLLGIYGAANLVASVIVGYFADRTPSRKLPLMLGLLTLTGSTAMYCFGTTPELLVIARGLQGASAAILRVVGLALMVDTYGANQAGAAMGWQSIAMFAGTTLGPALGGVVYDNFGHYAVFGMAFVVLVVDIVLRCVMIERKLVVQWVSDLGARSYGTVGEAAAIDAAAGRDQTVTSHYAQLNGYGFYESLSNPVSNRKGHLQRKDWQNLKLPASFGLLLKPRLLASLWATFVCAILMTSTESVLPLQTEKIFSWTPSETGVLFLTLAVSVLIDPYIGAVTEKQGPRLLTIIGLSGASAVYIGLFQVVQNTVPTKVALCVLLVLLGFFVGAIQTPNMVEISLVLDEEERKAPGLHVGSTAQAFSFLNVAYGLGSMIGPVWGGLVKDAFGWKIMCISFALFTTLSLVPTYLASGKKVHPRLQEG